MILPSGETGIVVSGLQPGKRKANKRIEGMIRFMCTGFRISYLKYRNKFRYLGIQNYNRPMENDWKKRLGVVYSTNPDFQFETETNEVKETVQPHLQKLIVRLDRKNRKGKAVTLVEGFSGSLEDLMSLARELKHRCGAGGSAKRAAGDPSSGVNRVGGA